MRNRSALLLVALLPVFTFGQSIRRAQHPAISPDGKVLVFSWQGDLWRVAAAGGRAERLTVHSAMEARPRWFPDGSRIAFISNRYGSNDVFTMKPDGTDLRRLTFDGASEIPTSVSSDGKTIYGYTNAWGRGDLFSVSAEGGDIVRLTDHPFEAEFMPFVSPDGKKVFYNRGGYSTTAWMKAGMTSAALPEVWSADNTVPLSNHRRVTNNEKTDLHPQVVADGSILTISNAQGMPNVWRMKADGSGGRALTKHTVGTARNLSASSDGRWVAYEQDSDLYLLDASSGTTKKLEITVPGDARNNPVSDLTLSTGVDQFSVSPDGKRAVIVVRGELFLIPEKGGTTRRLTTNPGWDLAPVWIDNRTILYVTAREGKRSLRTVTVDGVDKEYLSMPQDAAGPLVSPDGKWVAFHRGETEIAVVPAAGGVPRAVLRGNFTDAFEGPALFSWSPDSKWLVANVVEGRRINVVAVPIEGGKNVTVARLVLRPQNGTASTPRFLPNGRGVYFTSPEYDQRDLFIVDLVPPEVTFTEDDLDKIDEPKKEEKKEVKVEIYEPGIEYRLRRLTTSGASGPIASPDSKSILVNLRSPSAAGSQLVSIPVGGGTPTPVAAVTGGAGGAEYGRDGKKLYYVSGGRLFGYTPGTPAATPIPFNAQWSVNLKDEEMALFRDIAWAMERLYYDPQLHGKDWPAIRSRYEKIVPQTYDRADFYALMSEMMEELESSHLGASSPREEVEGASREQIAYIGIELDPAALVRGDYVVKRVIPQSPASDPQSLLVAGDRILLIDGVKPSAANPMSVLLNQKVGRRIDIQVERGGEKRTVFLKGGSSAQRSSHEYEAWVAYERSLVDRYSGGRLGYVHIQSMNQPSLQRFLREIHTHAEGKTGVLIDVRYNGGGSTAVDVLNVLIRQPWLIRTTRGELGLKLSENIFRDDALELPTALLVNTYSFSNAEIIAEGFRRLKRGPIIGERTPGYVIGTGGYRLWDGGSIRLPAIGAYTVDGENLENNGRRPDHVIWFDPNAWAKGEDPQLRKAVEVMGR